MELKVCVIIAVCTVAVAMVLLGLGNSMGSQYGWSTIGSGVASVCVPIAFFGIVLAFLFDSHAPTGTCVLAGGFAGAILAVIEYQLNSQNMFINSLIANIGNGADIQGLMCVTIVLWMLIGILFEVARAK